MCLKLNIALIILAIGVLVLNTNIVATFLFLIGFLGCFSILLVANSLIGIISVPITSRSYSNSMCIFLMHMLGDIPSPIICSYIWEKTNHLITSLYISGVPLLFSFVIYTSYIFYFNSKKKVLLGEELLIN